LWAKEETKLTVMTKSSSTLLIVLLMLFTFPIWLGLAGGIFGLIAGLFGIIFGAIGGLFGVVFGAIGSAFGAIFHGVFGWHGNWLPHFHFNGFVALAFVIVVALIISKRSKR
jgi:hypothetical protein